MIAASSIRRAALITRPAYGSMIVPGDRVVQHFAIASGRNATIVPSSRGSPAHGAKWPKLIRPFGTLLASNAHYFQKDLKIQNNTATSNTGNYYYRSITTSNKKSAAMNTEEDVRSLFHLWNDALATGDSSIVAQRYTTTDPLLLPTVSDVPRTDFASIKDYFDHFLVKQPKGEIVQGYTKIGDDWCSDAGTYEFTMGTTGDVVKARYSFVYVKEDGEWKIQHHHSSMMPQDKLGHAISKEEVRALFNLWNDALATGDPKQVAARYGKEAALLPTVSDVPRNDAAGIEDYFVHFLKNEPQGEILQGEIVIGTNWAQDSGIYEFTMGTTGAKVKGRYSYIYVYENDEWMISHHHSSVMPEGNIPKAITEQEVKDLFQIWNTALATEDPDSVAKCYSKNAVLLPTVSDKPRTDYELIKDYFVHFLQKKPSGTILESYVTIGHNYCQDVGIYEFALAATGDKVKGRYSFVYVWEDGAWKISHHHSSMMPEAFL